METVSQQPGKEAPPVDFELAEDDCGRIILKRPGVLDAVDVRIRRAFPWSHPDRHISIRGSEGKELLSIDDIAVLSAGQRALVERVLSETSFIPRIVRILEVDVRFGYQQWRVESDRGPVEFRVQEREDIRFLSDGRYSVKDADGNVYELPALSDLDDASRREVLSLL